MGTQIFDSQIKDSIALTGTPTAPTPSVSDDSTRIATTEFIKNQVASDTVKGMVELATSAEVLAGTDAERAVTPATLTAKIYGTASHVAGVPTGAIIEKGSNANGNYTKFADGTMICYNRVSIASSNNSGTSFTLPATYANSGYAVVASPGTVISSGSSASYLMETGIVSNGVINLKSLYVATGGTVSDSPNVPVNYQTIGRWH